ncbi:hypothetical protein BN6_50170 [Saccharothrix espanaensis DSM 44229]|uniref:Uncharacterized protein n=1 Tax=Saccharothrix espanaensis (strain ATCC 51144 / DSM 44229 / JCM 9112 / NBRC 15066 / NRRL 15764) TaxID=1179773 RepID=K0JWQ0_SACES|nr:hypothetical protein BN6_50170 [Saccharothrix espanaensis DSM 44229]
MPAPPTVFPPPSTSPSDDERSHDRRPPGQGPSPNAVPEPTSLMCVLTNPAKAGRFFLPERLALLADVTGDLVNVTVDSSPGRLLVDYCREARIGVIVRGVRTPADLEHELPMARANRHLSGLETLFVPTSPAHAYLSSTLVTATTRR